MALQKQNVAINFAIGLDMKTDPFQLSPGKFLRLSNMVFTKIGLLKKRNGFTPLSEPPSCSLLTTYQNNLMACGTSMYALLQGASSWFSQGKCQQVSLSVQPFIRPSFSPTVIDNAINSAYNMNCVVWYDSNGSAYYQVQSSLTSQQMVQNIALPAGAKNPRVLSFGTYFVITYSIDISGIYYVKFIYISATNPSTPSASQTITNTLKSATATYDAIVVNNKIFVAWQGNDGGGALRIATISNTFSVSLATAIAGVDPTLISIAADTSQANPQIYFLFYTGTTAYVTSYNFQGTVIFSPAAVHVASGMVQLTSYAAGGIMRSYVQISGTYSGGALRSDSIKVATISNAGTVTSASALFANGVGLAAKAFVVNGDAYLFTVYGSSNSGALQPTYFLYDASGNIIARVAYENAGGYYTNPVLPSVTVGGNIAYIPYLFKDIVQAANPAFITPPSTTGNIYSLLGANQVAFNFAPSFRQTSEIGKNLHLSGGFLWSYDGYLCYEQNFFLFPEDITASWSATGGSVAAQPDGATNNKAYYYQVTYEWTDAQGNIHRSAPSIPLSVTTIGTGTIGSITLTIPKLRQTYKSNVRTVIYRWSVGQQVYYQVTSITSPTTGFTSVDANTQTYLDTVSDGTIIGNNIIYTNGGVVEDISPPTTNILTLYKSRLVLVNAENPNEWWFSKQVLGSTSVEMSDLFTKYLAPTTGAQGSTGDISGLATMDDKLIFFKEDAIYYVVGTGPDNSGLNDDFSEPVFITSTVGCPNPQSIVFTPQGLIFQSNKGFWLLGRDLSTNYIGAPVEDYNGFTCTSALTIPETNEVRFTLNGSVILSYDYYVGQWATHSPKNIISSTLFNSMHTYLDSNGNVMQEVNGSYVDGDTPVLMGFTTGWFNLAGIQGFQRAYFFQLLATFLSPHKLNVQIAYDYGAPSQSVLLKPTPINYSPTFGDDNSYWGATPLWGGQSNLEQWQVNLQTQKCQSFQITLDEVYDASLGGNPGAGLTLSGLNLVVGLKKAYRPLPARVSA